MLKKEEIKGKIELKSVCFRYPSAEDHQVLSEFSLEIEAGKTTALVGPSGGGKSTIIQLLERFYDPTSGSIELDGEPLTSLNLRSMRQHMGYVGQEPVLFNTTIRENLLFAQPNATEDEMIEALKAANAWDFIQDKMTEHGLDTVVGATGGKLSGGQKQRIAIARAFLKKPRVLLLDEATSALDKVNEKAVQDAIQNYRKSSGDITIVVIAHRLSTIIDADKIVVVKDGKLVEMGTHSQLLQDHPQGTYAGFVAKQQTAEANNREPEEQATKDLEKLVDQSKNAGEVDAVEQDMKARVDKIDEETEKAISDKREELNKQSILARLYAWQEPKILIFVGILCSFGSGLCPPVFGLIMSKLLGILTVPVEFLTLMGQYAGFEGTGIEYLKSELSFWVGLMAGIGGLAFVSIFFQKQSFFIQGSNLTLRIRKVLYAQILQKHIGWFDDRDNGTSVLTSAMAEDTSVINGASTDSLGPQCEGLGALVIGLIIALVYCWQVALVTLALSPAYAIG